MNKVKYGAAAIAAILIAGGLTYWAKYESWVTIPRAREAFASQLRDPSSAQFRGDRFAKNDWLCGEVNGKNASGGYVGFKKFASRSRTGEHFVEESGRMGKRSTQDIIDVMDRRIAILETFIRHRKEFPGLEKPSDSEIDDLANAKVFTDKWAEVCET